MSAKKVFIAGILGGLAIFVVWLIAGIIVQAARLYDVMSLGGMRAANDPIMLLFFLHPWVTGFAVAIAYSQFGKAFEGSATKKGVKFGLIMWLVSNIPSSFVIYTSMSYPVAFVVVSVAGSFVYMVTAGVVIAKVMEK